MVRVPAATTAEARVPAAAVSMACAAAAEVPESEAARVGADAAARHQRRGRRRCRVSMTLDLSGGKRVGRKAGSKGSNNW
jgi:hypothetical protein